MLGYNLFTGSDIFNAGIFIIILALVFFILNVFIKYYWVTLILGALLYWYLRKHIHKFFKKQTYSLSLKKGIIMACSVAIAIIAGYFIYLFYTYIFLPPDMSIDTPPEIKTIVQQKLPKDYEVKSLSSVQKISEFEGVRTPMKWLKIRLKNKPIRNDKELNNIAKPICIGISKNGYQGVEISPNTSMQKWFSCGY
jgi:predicted PurR-regulated permease PerM